MITLYDGKFGHTKKVALKFDPNAIHVSQVYDLQGLIAFFCPTYGDAELPHDMDQFIYHLQIKDQFFILCELGNYYGQDDFEFGAASIIKQKLLSLGWQQLGVTLSLDSLPQIDWQSYQVWNDDIRNEIKEFAS